MLHCIFAFYWKVYVREYFVLIVSISSDIFNDLYHVKFWTSKSV